MFFSNHPLGPSVPFANRTSTIGSPAIPANVSPDPEESRMPTIQGSQAFLPSRITATRYFGIGGFAATAGIGPGPPVPASPPTKCRIPSHPPSGYS